jgi:hypothetical protein
MSSSLRKERKMHLITLIDSNHAKFVKEACAERFPMHKITIRKTEEGLAVESVYTGRKPLSVQDGTVYINMIPAFARAFYAGLTHPSKCQNDCCLENSP